MSIESALSKFGKILDSAVSSIKKTIKVMFVNSSENTKHRSFGTDHRAKHSSSSVTSPYAILIFDSFLAFLSIFISIHLRIGMDFLDYSPIYILKNMLVFGLVSSSIFLWLQTHQSFWRYTTIEDMTPIFLSVILSNLLFFPLMMLMNQEDFLPYSVLIINIFVLSFMLMIPRFLSRMIYNQKLNKIKRFDSVTKRTEQSSDIPEVLIIGNSASVEAFFREVISNDDVSFNFDPVGILTLDQADIGRIIKGVPILGELRDINRIIKTLNKEGIFPRQIVISEKNLPENAKKFLVRYVQEHGLLLMHVMFQCTFNTVSE